MSGPFIRFTGQWDALDAGAREALYRREGSAGADDAASVTRDAAHLVAEVRARGDAALREQALRFDGAALDTLEVDPAAVARALDQLDATLRRALERAAANVATVHRAFRPEPMEARPEPGIVVGRRPDPLDRVGVYAPGGRAVYPSSVLMAAIPARVAGVREVVLASPAGASGLPAAAVLAAAALCGVDRVFAIGGAGAVAAMAYGTESVPRVDRIVGPGNAYVAAAKTLVAGDVGIDCPAGPSELLVIADGSVDAALVAGEMVAQAEHDPHAAVAALVIGGDAGEVECELARQAANARRGDCVRAALAARGAVLSVRDAAQAIAVANEYAPEHLWLAAAGAGALLRDVRNAGTVFVGEASSVTFGDYITGANHVLPTGGAARWCSGLSPLDFVRWTTYQRVEVGAARSLAAAAARLAEAEQLFAHADAAARWSSAV